MGHTVFIKRLLTCGCLAQKFAQLHEIVFPCVWIAQDVDATFAVNRDLLVAQAAERSASQVAATPVARSPNTGSTSTGPTCASPPCAGTTGSWAVAAQSQPETGTDAIFTDIRVDACV